MHGAAVKVIAFDAISLDYRTGYTQDFVMGSRLADAVAASPSSILIALMGSSHAERSSAPTSNVANNTVVDVFGRDATVSLRMRYSGGTAWVCRGSSVTTLNCASTKLDGGDLINDRYPSISVSSVAQPMFDGYFYVGPITASPPAVGARVK
jgi:hypothetical protein